MHRSLAQQYSFQDEHCDAIGHAEKAMHLNDTLDLSLLLAQQYKAVEEVELARKTLIQHLDSTEEAWSLNQKGSLLLELNDAKTAIQAFCYAQKDTAAWGHYLNTGKALQELGKYDEARSYEDYAHVQLRHCVSC